MKLRRPSASRPARRSWRISSTGEIRGAVNAGGIKLDLPPDEAPFADLARRIGALLAGISEGRLQDHHPPRQRPAAQKLMTTLLRLATVELLKPHLDTPVNVINVEHLAKSRNIELVTIAEPAPPQGLVGDIVGVRAEGPQRRIAPHPRHGLCRWVCRACCGSTISRWTWFPKGRWCVILNNDQPGVIGTVGTTFGDAGVNIADMVISREKHADGTATAMMVLKTDSEPTTGAMNGLRSHPGILKVKSVVLPGAGRDRGLVMSFRAAVGFLGLTATRFCRL